MVHNSLHIPTSILSFTNPSPYSRNPFILSSQIRFVIWTSNHQVFLEWLPPRLMSLSVSAGIACKKKKKSIPFKLFKNLHWASFPPIQQKNSHLQCTAFLKNSCPSATMRICPLLKILTCPHSPPHTHTHTAEHTRAQTSNQHETQAVRLEEVAGVMGFVRLSRL